MVLALLINFAALPLGISEDGFGWALRMPLISFLSLASLVTSLVGLISSFVGIVKRRDRHGATALVLAGAPFTELWALVMLFLAYAAIASI